MEETLMYTFSTYSKFECSRQRTELGFCFCLSKEDYVQSSSLQNTSSANSQRTTQKFKRTGKHRLTENSNLLYRENLDFKLSSTELPLRKQKGRKATRLCNLILCRFTTMEIRWQHATE